MTKPEGEKAMRIEISIPHDSPTWEEDDGKAKTTHYAMPG